MARSPFFVRKQAGGVFHVDNTALTLGDIWYVNASAATTGTTNAYGQNPDAAFSSVLAAANATTALATGDMVLVAAGHTETLSAAADWDLDTIGVYYKGLGWGNIRPTITVGGDATSDIDIDAANVVLDNFIFDAGFADNAAVIDVNAAGFTCRNCSFIESTTDKNHLICILGATSTTSNRITVENCECFSVDSANTHFISLPGTSDMCVIRNNFIQGFFETGAIGAAGAVTNISVMGNFIQNTDTDADSCILLASSSTGIVAYNSVGAALAGDVTTNISCSSTVAQIQNFSVDTGDRSGVLDPVAT